MLNIHEEVLAYIRENQEENDVQKKLQSSEKTSAVESDNLPLNDILSYSKRFFFKIVDNREKGGALWVYHDRDDTIHAIQFKEMKMQYKEGRGWWIK